MREKKSIIINIVLSMIIIVPFLLALQYTVPAKDDFAGAVSNMKRIFDEGYIKGSLQGIYLSYMTAQGTWFGSVIGKIASPIMYYTGLKGMRIYQAIVILAYFFSICLFSKECYTNMVVTDKEKRTLPWICFFLSFSMCAFSSPNETFYWNAAVGVYTIPFIVALLGMSSFLCYIRTGKKRLLVLASILPVLSAGGTLQIAAFVTFINMVVAMLYVWQERTLFTAKVIPFITSFIGSLINVAAPGNYVRSTNYSDTGLHPLAALFNTAYMVIYEYFRVVIHSYLLVIIVACFIYILYSDFRIKNTKLHPLLAYIGLLGGIYITTFPVAFGYGQKEIPGIRIEFMMCAFVSMGMILWSIYTACWLKEHSQRTMNLVAKYPIKKVLVCSLIVFVLWQIAWRGKASITTTAPVRAIRELTDGSMKVFYEDWTAILEEIETSPDEDVIVIRDEIKECFTVKAVGLRVDKISWVNTAVAEYYGKNSVEIRSH